MPYLTLKDGTELFYKDWGNPKGQAVTFSHGWPLSSDNWENQMVFLAERGYRVVGHDRRGHGRSGQPWTGNNMDTFTDDLLQLFEHLNIEDVTMVGHSHGGGEVARFISRHGTSRVKKAVLVGAVSPLLAKTSNNPDGLPLSVFDGFRDSMNKNRSQFFLDVAKGPFFGFNRANAEQSEGLAQNWWRQGMMSSFKTTYDCVKDFSETDFTEDLRNISVPVLLLHGDDDQIVPFEISGKKSAKLIPNATLKVYKGGSHGIHNINVDQVNNDLLQFLQS